MPPYPTVTLKNGSQGQQVATLQALLDLDYPAYSHLDVDGEFGAQTEAVIREFQKRAGLIVNGVAGAETLAKLDELTTQGAGPVGEQMKQCNGGILASPSTSCPFAQNVRQEYFAVPGDSVQINVFSPVTHQTYTMACVREGGWVTCRGGNNAVVQFPFS
ncbi:peptidoglycan-binding domain-containing protein [Mycolicibacterium fortuitum]|uniref:Peptidoglycan-binding domain-containing protein n=2 Tax=Mycolicibacterium fortuitum TaxID=1766 RepID=A0AAE5AFR7_MYCFO|nr:peptidoglycan-binding domain-containing protein [Mycolicibacterium fortuitum]MDV7194748.1 peptidoglycan-binding domain-containing protein [Mycolicibacterium fortuitum]MDV7208231.1 peptidoglycan-binding domain-containing protein [Mycolicibacterium fortuitum]MDV7230194.1 peptidoglycan-binding domain-containing protein [Mycolicibacterium fortuitum]MDV7261957.1 peptidoglycan-binding domain-containing protein [Mycolicibacterium fortuitum]MDV7287114.1 peptidoglycan-binding domain-containing prote